VVIYAACTVTVKQLVTDITVSKEETEETTDKTPKLETETLSSGGGYGIDSNTQRS
jgi:hypothetical protein